MKDNNIGKGNIKDPFSILVIEDDDVLCKLIKKVVLKTGLTVNIVSKGADAIDYVMENPNTLMLIDHFLPDMTGQKVIQTLHAKLGKVYFIIMTGFGDEKLAVEMMKLGAQDYMTKDGNFVDLLQTVVKKVVSQISIERKLVEAETALIESEEKYRSLFEYAGDSIFIVDSQTYCLLDVNRNAAKRLGYTKDELLNMKLDDLYLPGALQSNKAIIEELREKGSIVFESVHRRKDGSGVAVEVSSRMLEYHGRVVFLNFVRDITERQRAEEKEKIHQQQLIQADKMASLGILVAGVSHEINNPNNFIMFNAPILTKIWKDVVPILKEYQNGNSSFSLGGIPYEEVLEAVPKLISGITEGSRRIKSICNKLRDFSRQDTSGRNSIIDLNHVINLAVDLLENLIKKYTQNFSANLYRALPPIRGNHQEIEQVVINLITNACQALTDQSKKVSIKTYYDQDLKNVIMDLVDEGKGIPSEDLPKITDPFFTTKRELGGTGLGLSISYNIIKEHGGFLSFSSELEKGTKVTIKLPAVERRK